jgi:hypothetical protein
MTTEVGGYATRIQVTKARPANTTAYAAKDVVSEDASSGTVWTFSNAARFDAWSGIITHAFAATDQEDETQRFRLWLYHTGPSATNLDDNGAFGFVYADVDEFIGYIDFEALAKEDATAGTGAYSTNPDVRVSFKCAAGDTDIYGVLETLDAYTPASGGSYTIELFIEQD